MSYSIVAERLDGLMPKNAKRNYLRIAKTIEEAEKFKVMLELELKDKGLDKIMHVVIRKI